MLWQIAWRNLWRSKGKTLVSLLLLMFSTFVLSTFIGLITGTFHKIYEDAIDIFPGYIHINDPRYTDDPSFDYLLWDITALKEALQKDKDIKTVTSRMESFFLFSSHENSEGGVLTGIEPSLEKATSKLHTTIIKGRFLKDSDTNAVAIGDKLAEKLHLDVGDTFSIIGTDIDYSFAADTLKVVGIFHTAIPDLDARFSVINKPYLQTLLGASNQVSRLVVTPFNKRDSKTIAASLQKQFGTQHIEIVDWHTHLSALIDSLDLIRISRYMLIYFFIAIIFAVITIFALLTLLARQREVGIMKALGTSPFQITQVLFIERFILSIISILMGTILSAFVSYYLQNHPIAINSIDEMVQRIGAMEFVFKSYFSTAILLQGALTIFVFSFVTIIYPTWRLSRQNPIDAINAI